MTHRCWQAGYNDPVAGSVRSVRSVSQSRMGKRLFESPFGPPETKYPESMSNGNLKIHLTKRVAEVLSRMYPVEGWEEYLE